MNTTAQDWIQEGLAHTEAEEFSEALACFQRALEIDSASAHASVNPRARRLARGYPSGAPSGLREKPDGARGFGRLSLKNQRLKRGAYLSLDLTSLAIF
jgi:hypothetical protein